MKYFVVLLNYMLFVNISIAQDIQEIDSLSQLICTSINTNSNLSDAELIVLVQNEHISPFILSQNTNDQNAILNHVLLRTEKLCPEYSALAYRTSENNGDWVLLSEKPKSILKDTQCSQFYKNQSYYYLEPTGEKVNLQIKDGYWIDTFLDKTYSKLKLIQKSNCDFVIQFIKSNNEMRMKFSKAGDRYKYRILSFEEDKYSLSVEVPGQNQYYKFILYKDQ